MNAARPVHTGFMDHGMRELWSKLGPMPEDLRLYGGTALALYLNHRSSTDFDFATPHGVVDTWLAANIKGVDPKDIESITGGPGMVDMTVQSRWEIKMTLIECGALIPHPSANPRTAQNGVKVAHPLDLVMAKLCAIADRGRVRDLPMLQQQRALGPESCAEPCASWHPERAIRWRKPLARSVLRDPKRRPSWRPKTSSY